MRKLPPGDLIMQAWRRWKLTHHYSDAHRSAVSKDEHVAGALWAAFLAGWKARESLEEDHG